MRSLEQGCRTLCEWIAKGFRVTVHGQLIQRPYEKRDGSSGVALEIKKCRISVLERREERESQEAQSYNARPSYNNQNNGVQLAPKDLEFCPFNLRISIVFLRF